MYKKIYYILICLILVWLMFPLFALSLQAQAPKEDEIKLYKNFYYGEKARAVYDKILNNSDLRPINLENSFGEWLESEKYDGSSFIKMKTLNEYYSMTAKTMLLGRPYICRFRIDKKEIILTRIYIYGPTHTFAEETESEIAALSKMLRSKYEEPEWKDVEEKEVEILNLANTYTYQWQDIWSIDEDLGKKEIKLGILNLIDSQKNEYYFSVISIEYLQTKSQKKEEEEIDEDFKDEVEDF